MAGEMKKPFVLTAERRTEIIELLRVEIVFLANKRREEIKRLAVHASLCIDDAFRGRLANGHAETSKKAAWKYQVFCIQTSHLFFRCVLGACFIHSMAIFYEPEQGCSTSSLYRYAQWLFMLIYVADVGMKMAYEGVQVSE
jgi:hypothetical protein